MEIINWKELLYPYEQAVEELLTAQLQLEPENVRWESPGGEAVP